MDHMTLYGVDENGQLYSSSDFNDFDDSYSNLFPDAFDSSSEISMEGTVSSGDTVTYIPYDGDLASDISSELDIVSYDELIDALAAIPGYNTYPNTAAVSVFDSVFVGNSHIHYICLADSDGTSLYYSDDYSLTDTTITLLSPVTRLRYYSVRSGTTTNYYYTVSSNLEDVSFTPAGQLIYTDLLSDYPSLPSDTRGVPGSSVFSGYLTPIVYIGAIFICVTAAISFVRREFFNA